MAMKKADAKTHVENTDKLTPNFSNGAYIQRAFNPTGQYSAFPNQTAPNPKTVNETALSDFNNGNPMFSQAAGDPELQQRFVKAMIAQDKHVPQNGAAAAAGATYYRRPHPPQAWLPRTSKPSGAEQQLGSDATTSPSPSRTPPRAMPGNLVMPNTPCTVPVHACRHGQPRVAAGTANVCAAWRHSCHASPKRLAARFAPANTCAAWRHACRTWLLGCRSKSPGPQTRTPRRRSCKRLRTAWSATRFFGIPPSSPKRAFLN